MRVTRREFLARGATALAAGAWGVRCAHAMARGLGIASPANTGVEVAGASLAARVALVDLGAACCLRESLEGYARALRELGAEFVVARADKLPAARTVIIPGAGQIGEALAGEISRRLEAGSDVIVEVCCAYASPEDFEASRAALWRNFQVRVGPGVDLWAGARGRVPYVELTWPERLQVRDFSRVHPVEMVSGSVIGWIEKRAIAAVRNAGRGRLVVLGSALGPALAAGDREGRAWLGVTLLDAV